MSRRDRRAPVPPPCWACLPGTPVGAMCDPCTAWTAAVVRHQSTPLSDQRLKPRRIDFGPIRPDSSPAVQHDTNETGLDQ